MIKLIFLNIIIFVFCFSLYAEEGTLVDACGRSIFVPEHPKRIVAIGPGASALTVYADYAKSLVAKEVYGNSDKLAHYCKCTYPVNYTSMPTVYRNLPNSLPDFSAIRNVKPDLIIASGFTEKQVDTIYKSTRIPVASVSCGETGYMHFDAIIQSLRLTGYILKHEKAMQDIMNYLMKIRKELYDRTVDVPAKKIFVMSETYDDNSKNLTSEKCYVYLRMINQKNTLLNRVDNKAYYKVNRDELLTVQPEYIFIEYTLLDRIKKDYAAHKSFYNSLNAVKNGKVFTIMPYNRFSANLESVCMNAYYIGQLISPDNFKDIKMHDISDEITEEFTGDDIYEKLMKNTSVFRNVTFTSKGIVLK